MAKSREEVGELVDDPPGAPSGGLDQLVPMVYDELRRIAHRQLRGERSDHTLDTGALVHEAYLAAGAMRRILVDCAVARKTRKRGGAMLPTPRRSGNTRAAPGCRWTASRKSPWKSALRCSGRKAV